MQTSRRQFIAETAVGGLGLVATPLLPARAAQADTSPPKSAAPPVVASLARYYRLSPGDGLRHEEIAWVQVDLGITRPIDAIRLRPAAGTAQGQPSPLLFCIDCSDDPDFAERQRFALWHAGHPADAMNFLAHFPQKAANARYIRLTASTGVSTSSAMLASGLAAIEILTAGSTMTLAVRRWEATRRRGMFPDSSI